MNQHTHTCPRCEETKPLSEFGKDRSKASGHKSACKECDRKKAKHYYEKAGRDKRGHVRTERRSYSEPIAEKECPECGHTFTPSSREGIYCSHKCFGISRRATHSKARKRQTSAIQMDLRICKACGAMFAPARRDGITCSKACVAKVRRMRENRKSLKRFKWMEATKVEPIDPLDIYTRDNWTCQLCGESISQEVAWPDPMSPSLDHIRPVSWGGHHIKSNIQAAHLICNQIKGARGEMDEDAIAFRVSVEKLAG